MNELEQLHLFAYWDNCFTDEELNILNALYDENLLSKAAFGSISDSNNLTEEYRLTDVFWLEGENKKYSWLFEKLIFLINELNNKFFNFHINFMSDIQYTVYKKNYFYKKHADVQYTKPFNSPQRKLTFSLQLSENNNYEGGDLILYNSEYPQIMKSNKGTLNVFPSYILHEVTPILSGERRALVGWACGNNFI